MAYLRSLAVECNMCSKKATQELFNRWNASLGRYCTAHAKAKLAGEQLREEKGG